MGLMTNKTLIHPQGYRNKFVSILCLVKNPGTIHINRVKKRKQITSHNSETALKHDITYLNAPVENTDWLKSSGWLDGSTFTVFMWIILSPVAAELETMCFYASLWMLHHVGRDVNTSHDPQDSKNLVSNPGEHPQRSCVQALLGQSQVRFIVMPHG